MVNLCPETNWALLVHLPEQVCTKKGKATSGKVAHLVSQEWVQWTGWCPHLYLESAGAADHVFLKKCHLVRNSPWHQQSTFLSWYRRLNLGLYSECCAPSPCSKSVASLVPTFKRWKLSSLGSGKYLLRDCHHRSLINNTIYCSLGPTFYPHH